MKVQDKENAQKVCMSNDNGQYNREIYRRAEYTIPQSDGTYNVSDSSDVGSHDYLDLANTDTDIQIPHSTIQEVRKRDKRQQKQN